MRKRFVPLVIAVIIAALTLWGNYEVKTAVNATREQLSTVRAYAEKEDYSGAEESIKKLLCVFDAKQDILELFLKHDAVMNASVSLHGLPAYANEETVRDLLSEIDKASEQLNMLYHSFFSFI